MHANTMHNHTNTLTVEAERIREQLALLAGQVQATAVHLSTADRMFLKDFQRERYPRIGAVIRLYQLAQLSPFPEVRGGLARIFPEVPSPCPQAPNLVELVRESGEAVVALVKDETERTPQSRMQAVREVRECVTALWSWLESRLRMRAA